MYRRSSRGWAFTGAVACCLTPLWWPLGLIIGIGAIVLLIFDKQLDNAPTSTALEKNKNPRVSVMAIIASSLVILPIVFLLALFLYLSLSAKTQTF